MKGVEEASEGGGAGEARLLPLDTEAEAEEERGDGGVRRGGDASIMSAVSAIANTVLGGGALAMPGACMDVGVALFLLLLAGVAVLAHRAVVMLAESVEAVRGAAGKRSVNYPVLGRLSMGRAGEEAAKWAVVLQQTGPCIIYIQLISDIYAPVMGEAFSGGSVACSRAFWMVLIVFAIILPLCMIRNIDSLKYTSWAALVFICAMTLCVVYVGAGVLADKGKRTDLLVAATSGGACGGDGTDFDDPGTKVHGFRLGVDTFKALPILCFSFLMHQNAFPIMASLRNPSPARMGTASSISMVLCFAVYALMGAFGYVAFLEATQSDVLLNFATTGTSIAATMNVLRFCFGLALIFSYPVIMWELREVVDVQLFGHREPTHLRTLGLNLGIIIPALALAISIKDVGVVFGLIGSTCSPTIVFILPPLFWLKLHPDASPGKRLAAQATLALGLILVPVSVTVWAIDL